MNPSIIYASENRRGRPAVIISNGNKSVHSQLLSTIISILVTIDSSLKWCFLLGNTTCKIIDGINTIVYRCHIDGINTIVYRCHMPDYILHRLDWIMVFNATFNNISVMSWRSVSLVKEITLCCMEYTRHE
jgi:hypothetical protein